MRWVSDVPQATGYRTTTDEWRFSFTLSVTTWGANTGNWSLALLVGTEVDSVVTSQAILQSYWEVENNGTDPGGNWENTNVWLDVDTVYYVWGCAFAFVTGTGGSYTPCEDEDSDAGYVETFYTFTTFSDGSVFLFTPDTHPLAVHLASLGVDVSLSLYLIGMAPLAIASLFFFYADRRIVPGRLFVPTVIIVSANIFLRFWPPFVAIFLFLFTGYLFVVPIIGKMQGGAEEEAERMKKEAQASQMPL